MVQNLITDLSEKEAHDALTSAVCKDAKTHEDVCVGLIYVILTDQQNAARVRSASLCPILDNLTDGVDFLFCHRATVTCPLCRGMGWPLY